MEQNANNSYSIIGMRKEQYYTALKALGLPENKFNVGDIVVIKGIDSCPQMSVKDIRGEEEGYEMLELLCVWLDKNHCMQKALLNAEQLQLTNLKRY